MSCLKQSRVVMNAGGTAEVYLYDAIGGYLDGISAMSFVEELRPLRDAKRIDVRINSPGGDVFDGLAIFNTLARYKGRIATYIDGMAFSIASVIALAGDTVTMADNAMLMIHDPWSLAIGNSADFRRLADDLDKNRDQLVTIYEQRTNLKSDRLRSLMAAETYLDAKEAKRDGFVHAVVESKRIAACAVDPKTMPYLASAKAQEYLKSHGTVAAWEATATTRSNLVRMQNAVDKFGHVH